MSPILWQFKTEFKASWPGESSGMVSTTLLLSSEAPTILRSDNTFSILYLGQAGATTIRLDEAQATSWESSSSQTLVGAENNNWLQTAEYLAENFVTLFVDLITGAVRLCPSYWSDTAYWLGNHCCWCIDVGSITRGPRNRNYFDLWEKGIYLKSIYYESPMSATHHKIQTITKPVSRYVGGQFAKAAKRQHGSGIPGH